MRKSGVVPGVAVAVAVAAFVFWASAAGAAVLSGRIIDAETGEPVAAATVKLEGRGTGVIADSNGVFTLDDFPEEGDRLVVAHIAYRLWRRSVQPGGDLLVRLDPVLLPGQDIVVTTTRAKRGESPVAFENLSGEEIRSTYQAQDVPMLLTQAPGVYAFSDNGNGIGYSYLSIRGFTQRRVSVLVNGVPLNDPESHEVYWIDLPDLAESIEDVQIQRGVGTTLYGANSIGGTINVRTDRYSPVRDMTFSSGFGSYDTRRFSFEGNSGLIDDRYTLYGRFSRVVSDGYRQNAWTDLWSYYFSGARYDEKWTNRINVFGGPEETHLAYEGIPRRFIEGDTTFEYNGRRPTGDPDADRRYNPFEWNGETDNFNQPQYQWLSEFRPDSNWLFENTLFYIKGDGYYDQLRFGESFSEYHLTPFTQLVETDTGVVEVEVDEADQLWRRRWVDNDFWGIVPKATRRHGRGTLTVGGEFQRHHGDHWAELQSVTPVGEGFRPGQRYYDYEGRKVVVSGFAQEVYSLTPAVTLTGALQYSFKEYRLFDNRFANLMGQKVTHTTTYNFISPRAGVTVRPADRVTVFGSVSYNEQEPTNDEIFDPQDVYSNAADFFESYDPATGVGSDPIMKPERLVDFELGGSYQTDRVSVVANLFHMRFHDEIVYNGLLNDDGVPLRANAPTSIHQGIEIAGQARLGRGFSARGNLSVNDNTFDEFIEYVPDWANWGETLPIDTVDRAGNTISGSPRHLANLFLNWQQGPVTIGGHVFSAGRLYIDNSESDDASIDPYTVLNLRGEVRLGELANWPDLMFVVHVNNVLDEEYETGGYIDAYPLFLPAAKRNFYVGMRAGL
ncbi:MAG: TonB-dependent receptor [Candidatus Zixiibacteriota bacterium]